MRIELTPAATCVSARGQRPNRVFGKAAVCTHQTWACFEAFCLRCPVAYSEVAYELGSDGGV